MKNRRKQRHTAKRVYDRLKDQYQANLAVSYRTVARYVATYRKQQRQDDQGYLELSWHPGECQADFGECDLFLDGRTVTAKFLVVTFPYSNVGYVQCFLGETAECICQGLINIFEFIGGVPRRIVIDNATGAGRRTGEKVSLTELFGRFQAHFGFSVSFCNPYSGHEKGSVENKVGYFRRNIFVPIPQVSGLKEYNKQLLEDCQWDNQRDHYKLGVPMSELFKKDRQSLLTLPNLAFEACRYLWAKTDNYGKFCIDGCHYYGAGPAQANKNVLVRLSAFQVEALDKHNRPLVCFERKFGTKRTDTTSWVVMLDSLVHKPGAWHNSGMREHVSPLLRDYLDGQDKAGIRELLGRMKDLTQKYDIDVALSAMDAMVCAKLRGESLLPEYWAAVVSMGQSQKEEIPVDLGAYDALLGGEASWDAN